MTHTPDPKDALLPCPFCGAAAARVRNTMLGDNSMAACVGCGAMAYDRKWNRRATIGQEDGWREIESAPRDGTEVFVWCPAAALVPCAMHFVSRKYLKKEYGDPDYMEQGWYLSYSYPGHLPEIAWEPTHWKPLPPPPRKP